MYRFFITLSGRCYVLQDRKHVFFYSTADWTWQATTKTLEELQADKRTKEVSTEDAFPFRARKQFQQQFAFRSARSNSAYRRF